MAEKCAWIEQVIEYPEEIIYDEKFTLTFTPDYMIILEDGCIVMVMLMPYHLSSTQSVQKKWYALMEYCRLHGYGCVLYELESTAVNNKTNVEQMQMIVTESLIHKT